MTPAVNYSKKQDFVSKSITYEHDPAETNFGDEVVKN